MVESLLQTFVEDCPGRFAALEKAVQEEDAKAIESAAHAYKSGSGTIRASVLAERLAFVEAAAHSGRSPATAQDDAEPGVTGRAGLCQTGR